MVEPELRKRYIDTGKVKLVWRDFAWIGEESRLAAQGARCAGQQGTFWDYHDYLYNHQRGENRGQFAAPNLKAFATELGLDTAAFGSCVDKGEDIPRIQQEMNEGLAKRVNGTPYFFVNGQPLAGALPIDQFAKAIDAAFARAGERSNG